jgi:alkylresorcinol/alkylpyrone synthase
MDMARIVSIGTAVPEHRVAQQEAKALAQRLFPGADDELESMFRVFDSAQVQIRYSAAPLDWFTRSHSFPEKNALYVAAARTLSVRAIQACLAPVGLSPEDIDHLIVVSTTGIATPSLDALLINDLKMRRGVIRTPIWGLGCSGGVAGVARAAEFATARPRSRIVVVAVELCTLTFMQSDGSKENLIATSLFGDGAAAALITGTASGWPGPAILAHTCTTWPASLDVMGWHIVEDGFKLVLSKAIPAIVRNNIRTMVEAFLEENRLPRETVGHYITHPGGPRVIDAYREALDLDESQLRHTRAVLRDFGNMSSPTVLFVLERFLDQLAGCHGEYGLASALGPGFSAEMLLLQWT